MDDDLDETIELPEYEYCYNYEIPTCNYHGINCIYCSFFKIELERCETFNLEDLF